MMVLYAYRDVERKQEVFAHNAYKEDKGVRFYCPNIDCKAHLYICGREGSSSFYFSATRKEYGHMKDCDYSAKNKFNPTNFNESKFNFDQALSNLTRVSEPQTKKSDPGTHQEGSSTLKPPRTIRQIYNMCKQYHSTNTYNGIIVGKMLLSDQSINMYPNLADVIGWRIIEATRRKPNYYNKDIKVIYLVAPINKKTYHFVLQFNNIDLYNKMNEEIWANRANKNLKIIVAGEWDYSNIENDNIENQFTTTILSKSQFKIMI